MPVNGVGPRAVICDPQTQSLRACGYPVLLVLMVVAACFTVALQTGPLPWLLAWSCWALVSLGLLLRWLVKLAAVVAASNRANVLFTSATLRWWSIGLLLVVLLQANGGAVASR